MIATVNHIPDIIKLMMSGHKTSLYKDKAYNLERVSAHLQQWILDPFSIVLVNKKVTACYIVSLQHCWWSDKLIASDVFFYSETPGAGFRLMKKAQEWVDNWGDAVLFENISTSNANKDVDKMYQRLGYEVTGFKYIRGKK